MQRIRVKGTAAFQSTPAEYMRDMLRYDDGKIEAIWDYPTGKRFESIPFTAIVQLGEYTPQRWRSFGLVTDVLGDVGEYSCPGYTVDEWSARGEDNLPELAEGTMKITITEAALKVLAGPRFNCWWQDEYGLTRCDKCLVFITGDEVGYRDESRVECKECHQHDWRCDEDFGEDNLPEEKPATPIDKVQAALNTLQNSEPEFRHRTKVDIVQEYLSQEYHIRIIPK